jgi:drug/metabolite transporter (DMT)-like permease
VATGGVETAALPFAAISAALHLAYMALLARAYQGGEVSVVYPVSRGVAPVLVLAFGALLLAEGATAVQVAGVAGVSLGVLLVGSVGPRSTDNPSNRGPRSRDVAFGLAIAVMIAAYTLVDAEGVDRARAPAYLFLLLAPAAVIYATALALRGAPLKSELAPRTLLAGAFIVGAYGCVLAALRLTDAAPVAAVRESSVVIAALLAAAVLHEDVDGRRIVGATAVVAGVAAIALG